MIADLPRRPLVRHDRVAGPAEAEMTATRELLARVAAGEHPPVLRLYRPRPTVAFGRREVRRPGYPAAVAAARAHGFEPVVRNAGGQAVAYGHGSLVVELLAADPSPPARLRDRFEAFAGALAAALRSLGVAATTGRLDGEYCPGDHSVLGSPGVPGGVEGRVKLAGTAQRLVARGWLCSASVVVTGAAPLRAALVDVNRHLTFDWRPATMGAVADLVPAVTMPAVEAAVVSAFGAVPAAEPAVPAVGTASTVPAVGVAAADTASGAPAGRMGGAW